MKKNVMKVIFKSVVFITIFCIIFSGVSYALVRIDYAGYQNITEFYSQPKESLDAVYIGSSNCFTFWNPLFAWNQYGICVYPYSGNANPYFSTEYIIKEARKTQPNATFIVNLNSVSDGELSEMHMHNIIDVMPFSFTKLELINNLCNIADIEGNDRAEYYIPLIRFHSFTNLSKPFYKPTGCKGAFFYDELNVPVDVSSLYVAPNEIIDLPEKITSSTDSLLDYCTEENINVLFVVVPQARDNIYEMNRLESLSNYISKKGYPVLNLSKDFEEKLNLDMTKDYYNGPHTNMHGSLKYTYYLSEYLINNYGFEDKRNNEQYADWHSSYEKYMEYASGEILDIEFDYDHRDFSIEEPVFQVNKVNDSVKIECQPVENADGYLVYKKTDSSPHWENVAEVLSDADALEYTDTKLTKDDVGYYTVVPFAIKNGTKYYGDFNYLGISTAQ